MFLNAFPGSRVPLRGGLGMSPKSEQHNGKTGQNEHIRKIEDTGLEVADPEHDEVDHPAVVVEAIDKIAARSRKKKAESNEPDPVDFICIGQQKNEPDDHDNGGDDVDRAPKTVRQPCTNAHERAGVFGILESHHAEYVNRSSGVR